MMKMTGKAFAKKLFGANYERLPRALFMDLVVFWGLYIAGFQVQIAPAVRILMISSFTAGVMWQALTSEDNAVELTAMLMLPHRRREFVFSYAAVLGAYAVLTKAGLLLAVLLAVSGWSLIDALGMVFCMVHAVLMAAAAYYLRKYWYAGGLWGAVIVAAILFWGSRRWVYLLLLANGAAAVLILWRTDSYAFYCKSLPRSQRGRLGGLWKGRHSGSRQGRLCSSRHGGSLLAGGQAKLCRQEGERTSIWRYFFRYLGCHKNYLLNTAVMWCAAIVMPCFLKEMDSLSVTPVGFAVLSLNTPICILLSCDRDLEQAVRFLPGQKQLFCIPYCLFIFLCNMAADVIFLSSWQLQEGGVNSFMIAGAVFFALQSALL